MVLVSLEECATDVIVLFVGTVQHAAVWCVH